MNRQEKYNEIANATLLTRISNTFSTLLPTYTISNGCEPPSAVMLCTRAQKSGYRKQQVSLIVFNTIVVDFHDPTNVEIYRAIYNKESLTAPVTTTEFYYGSLNNRDYYMYTQGFSRQELVLLPYLYHSSLSGAERVTLWGTERTRARKPQTPRTAGTLTQTTGTQGALTQTGALGQGTQGAVTQTLSAVPAPAQFAQVQYQINHKNMDKATFNALQLELITKQENRRHAQVVAQLHRYAEDLGFSIEFLFLGLSAQNQEEILKGAKAQYIKSYDTRDNSYYFNYLHQNGIIKPFPFLQAA